MKETGEGIRFLTAPELQEGQEIIEELDLYAGADIITDADDGGKQYLLEFSGLQTGLFGIQDLDDSDVEPDEKARARGWGLGHKNPAWFEKVTDNKSSQMRFIPEEHYAGFKSKDALRHLDRAIIIKPDEGSQGRGIVVQAFVQPSGAERAPENLKGHAASLRIAGRFRVFSNGEIKVDKDSLLGYQRVSPYTMDDIGHEIDGRFVTFEDVFIVNRARGAKSVPWSPAEKERALSVVLKVVKNLAEYNRTRKEYPREMAYKREQCEQGKISAIKKDISDLDFNLRAKFDVRVKENIIVKREELPHIRDFMNWLTQELESVDATIREHVFKKQYTVEQMLPFENLRVHIELQRHTSRKPYIIECSLKKVGALKREMKHFYDDHPLY